MLVISTSLLAACSGQLADSLAEPDQGVLPPVLNPLTRTARELIELPPPRRKVAVAVYNYSDQTGQFKPADGVQQLSKAVTQGATSVLIKALQDAGNGSWFTVVERNRLDNLMKERRIITNMRSLYLGERKINPKALPPLLFAGILLEGGIIGYDSNTKTGGAGARYLGIGGDVQYREDTVTVYLRAVSTKTGEVLLSIVSHKTIISIGVRGSAFKFVAIDKILEAEAGITRNEPEQLARAAGHREGRACHDHRRRGAQHLGVCRSEIPGQGDREARSGAVPVAGRAAQTTEGRQEADERCADNEVCRQAQGQGRSRLVDPGCQAGGLARETCTAACETCLATDRAAGRDGHRAASNIKTGSLPQKTATSAGEGRITRRRRGSDADCPTRWGRMTRVVTAGGHGRRRDMEQERTMDRIARHRRIAARHLSMPRGVRRFGQGAEVKRGRCGYAAAFASAAIAGSAP